MANRTRNKQLNLKFTELEYELFIKKQQKSGTKNYSDFIMKLLINADIYNLDLTPMLSLATEINKIGVNINQIAKVANITQSVYIKDITALQDKMDKIENILNQAILNLAEINRGDINSIYKNKANKI